MIHKITQVTIPRTQPNFLYCKLIWQLLFLKPAQTLPLKRLMEVGITLTRDGSVKTSTSSNSEYQSITTTLMLMFHSSHSIPSWLRLLLLLQLQTNLPMVEHQSQTIVLLNPSRVLPGLVTILFMPSKRSTGVGLLTVGLMLDDLTRI